MKKRGKSFFVKLKSPGNIAFLLKDRISCLEGAE